MEVLQAFVGLPLPEEALAVISPGKHVNPAIELIKMLSAAM